MTSPRPEKGIWVVEMFINGKWDTTTAVGICREAARNEQKDMAAYNPDDKFRIRKYIREIQRARKGKR